MEPHAYLLHILARSRSLIQAIFCFGWKVIVEAKIFMLGVLLTNGTVLDLGHLMTEQGNIFVCILTNAYNICIPISTFYL